MLNLPVPEAEYINEVLKPSEIQKEMVSSFADRAEMVRGGVVDAKDDNMLKITNDGRKCALDQRLINDMLPDEEDSKVNRCVKMYLTYGRRLQRESQHSLFSVIFRHRKMTVLLMYMMMSVRNWWKKAFHGRRYGLSMKQGQRHKKQNCLQRYGQDVRVLLGSTPKLGAGTNIQDRLIALHHLDCP